MEQQREGRIMEGREELMVSPTGDGKPTLRMAHFLNPSLSSNDNPLHTLSPLSLSSKTSKTQTQKNPLKVSFKGWRNPQKKWKIWVDHMCSLHKPLWEKAGIYESIMGSVYSIRKDCELVIKVAEKWCPETNSFVFPFGEATVTLEDMMTLGGYSVLGDSVLTPLPLAEWWRRRWILPGCGGRQCVFGAFSREQEEARGGQEWTLEGAQPWRSG